MLLNVFLYVSVCPYFLFFGTVDWKGVYTCCRKPATIYIQWFILEKKLNRKIRFAWKVCKNDVPDCFFVHILIHFGPQTEDPKRRLATSNPCCFLVCHFEYMLCACINVRKK